MKKLLVIGAVFPEPVSSAAGTKMMQWLSFFHRNNYQIAYASTSPESEFSADLSPFVSEQRVIKVNDDTFSDFILRYVPDIVLYDRFMVEEQFSWRVREALPSAVHLLETQDLHFLRESRLKNIPFLNQTTKREIASVLRCDLSFIISAFEYEFLLDNFPFLDGKLFYFPLCYEVNEASFIPVSGRKDFCFIGNFLHEPNRQASLFIKKIWQEIRRELPDVNFHLYGAYPNQQVLQLKNEKEGFFVHGRAESAAAVFSKHKVLLAPLLSGAGLKGKLLEAMQLGIVSVTTPIGSEGIETEDNWNGKIVSTEDVVAAATELYRDDSGYETYQQKGLEILKEKFNISQFEKPVSEIIEMILKDVNHWRQKYYLSEILNHHRQQSVRYLSKWIASKQTDNN